MADSQEIPKNQVVVQQDGISRLLNHPEVRDLGVKIAMKAVKDAAGINTEPISKKAGPATRAIYALRDFIQGTFWVFLISMVVMMLNFVLFLWLRKVLGV